MCNRDGAYFVKRSGYFFGIDGFAGANRGVDSSLASCRLVDKLPRNHVFVPSESLFIECLTYGNSNFDVHMTEVIGSQQDFVPDGISNGRHEFARQTSEAQRSIRVL